MVEVPILKKVLKYLLESNLFACDIVNAPIRKGKNIEYVLHISKKLLSIFCVDPFLE